jgi:hypothetical protein
MAGMERIWHDCLPQQGSGSVALAWVGIGHDAPAPHQGRCKAASPKRRLSGPGCGARESALATPGLPSLIRSHHPLKAAHTDAEAHDQRRRGRVLGSTALAHEFTALRDSAITAITAGQQRRVERAPLTVRLFVFDPLPSDRGQASRTASARMGAPRTRDEIRPNCNGSSPAAWDELSPWHAIEMQPSASTPAYTACTHAGLSPAWQQQAVETATATRSTRNRHIGRRCPMSFMQEQNRE